MNKLITTIETAFKTLILVAAFLNSATIVLIPVAVVVCILSTSLIRFAVKTANA